MSKSKKVTSRAEERRRRINYLKKKQVIPRLKRRVLIPTILTVLFVFIGGYCLIHSFYYQSTDDATVEGHIVSISPKVSGYILHLYVDDNQPIKKGQVIAEIDPRDYQVALAEAKGKLAEAKAGLNVSNQQISEAQENSDQSADDVVSAQSKFDFAKKDYRRYSSSYKVGISSKQDYDNSKTNFVVASSGTKSAKDKLKALKTQVKSEQAKKQVTVAQIQKLEADVKQAELNLSYTKIIAPVSGNVTARSVEKGNFVDVGQPLLALVPKKMWIVANFKETQLTNIQAGEPVNIKIDTYPGVKFKGVVDSIQRATGAKASLFPPENAVGSYVKVVQRVPVKIWFVGDYSKYNIVPGLSVVPEVKIR